MTLTTAHLGDLWLRSGAVSISARHMASLPIVHVPSNVARYRSYAAYTESSAPETSNARPIPATEPCGQRLFAANHCRNSEIAARLSDGEG